MKCSLLALASALLTTSLFACGSKPSAGSKAGVVQSETHTSQPKPMCLSAEHAETELGKKLTEYEKGLLYAYYCK